MKYNYQNILENMPHRFPFLLIDKIVSHEYRQSIEVIKHISFSDPIFQGHFPVAPIYPGVFIIEAGLQATRLMISNIDIEINNKMGMVIKVENFQFRAPVRPGDSLHIKCQLMTEVLGMIKTNVVVKNDEGTIVAKGNVIVSEEVSTSVPSVSNELEESKHA